MFIWDRPQNVFALNTCSRCNSNDILSVRSKNSNVSSVQMSWPIPEQIFIKFIKFLKILLRTQNGELVLYYERYKEIHYL